MKTQNLSLEFNHFPVMLSEIIKLSSPINGGIFVDCTFGGGGYSNALLQFPKTKVIGIDRDQATQSVAYKLKKNFKVDLNFIKLNLVRSKLFLKIT